jgi:hypothetical protein
MKFKNSFFVIILLIVVPLTAIYSQGVPNGGFENWTGTNINDWIHNGSSVIPTVTQTADAYSGNFAAHGEVIDFFSNPFPPTLSTGSQFQPYFAFTGYPSSLTGYYKFEPQGGDILLIDIVLINQSIGGGGEGHIEIAAGTGSYQLFEAPITYSEDNPSGWRPTDATITVIILPVTGDLPHIGTKFTLDHFSFEGEPLNVKEINTGLKPDKFELHQNYPNPFNPTTSINFTMAEPGNVTLQVYNMLGENVAELVNGYLNTGSYSADWNSQNFVSGTYIYRLTTDNFSESRKMILLK